VTKSLGYWHSSLGIGIPPWLPNQYIIFKLFYL
jgi:hypothetical protein